MANWSTHYQLDQNTPEWLKAKIGHWSASRAYDLMAYTKKGEPAAIRTDYIAEMAVERLTGLHADHFVTTAMQRGKDMEPEAAAAYQARTGDMLDPGGWWVLDQIPNIGASPDGLVGYDMGIEIKCPMNSTKHLAVLRSKVVPEAYVPQVQWQMWVTGFSRWRFISYDPRFPESLCLAIVDVVPDKALHDKFAAEVAKAESEVEDIINQIHKETTL